MFDKTKNELSIILHKYRKIIDYDNIENNKLRYSVKAHLNGKLHMKTLYLDNVPTPIRWNPKQLEHIDGQKYRWNITNQEEFISNSDWFKTEIKPLIAYDYAKNSNKFADFSKEIYTNLFGNDNLDDPFHGQFLFSNVPKEKCLRTVLAFVLLYHHNIELNKLLKLVYFYYPVKHKDKDVERNTILLLTKWHRAGYLICNNLKFTARKRFFVKFLGY